MEFGDTLVQFNIFEAMKHPTEDHSLFGIDLINELVEYGEGILDFAGDTDAFDCLRSIIDEADCDNLWEKLVTTAEGLDHVATPSVESKSSRLDGSKSN
ncbi:hypothetical protein CR513_08267, partial [Mucuna pruriens]